MKRVAGDRLHHLRQEIIGKAAKQIADEPGAALGVLECLHRHPECGSADQHDGAGEGGGLAAADDPADRAPLPDQCRLDRASARKLDRHGDQRRADREMARADCVPAAQDDLPGLELDHLPERLEDPARFPGERRQQEIAGECPVGLNEHVRRHLGHGTLP